MKKIWIAIWAFVLFSSHTMFLKLDSYFLEPNTSATIQLFNGTFDKSENVIDRDRMLNVSILSNGQRTKVADSQWSERDSITILNFKTAEEGTYIAGVSTAPRSIEMDAEAFNTYLEHEGILDMIAARENTGGMDSAAVEKYSKHVKTVFQVGTKRTDDWRHAVGYPIEFVPLQNPYDLNTGDSLKVQLLFNGEPLKHQLVYADFKAPEEGHSHEAVTEHGHSHEGDAEEHSHDTKTENGHSHEGDTEEHSHDTNTENGHSHDDSAEHSHDANTESGHSHEGDTEEHSHDANTENGHSHDEDSTVEPHTHTSGQKLRTDDNGIVTAQLTADGIWYLQTIHLVNTAEEGFTHESNWTTLTFQVTHAHGADTHIHEHEDEDAIPSWAYWAGSILLVGLLFFWFNRKK